MKLKPIPLPWSTLINDLSAAKGTKAVYLAGGAPRDYLLNRRIKDIDLFVYTDNYLNIRDCLEGLGSTLVRSVGSPDGFYEGLAHERGIQAIDYFDGCGEEIQIIYLAYDMPLVELLEGMDFGLCQVGTDGKSWTFTEAFIKDLENQTLTHYRYFEAEKRMKERYARLSKKYPNMKLKFAY
ncbi:hypothetical protein H0A36_28325 [Endozoicomonas sp. SM1973]|uniref:Poly A polymerase head domain-containing protein n=1 Tax=Spartinivicinus marinus TaxID=2994442 RepID=A0A853ILI9_9GAMM|nr:hypothetical protein [Spartinivicinus marinus]MCX4024767.1 hypothetical protein [Spartinivicinus marinus]NYZ69925.1 hypothetical protein [Spartinivicinus marinus]